MPDTSASLLDRLRLRPADDGWLRRHGVADADADDLGQEVLTVVVRRLSDFCHNRRRGAFRAWLRAITVNCLRDFWRAQRLRPAAQDFGGLLDQLADDASALSREWDREHDLHVT